MKKKLLIRIIHANCRLKSVIYSLLRFRALFTLLLG